MKKLLTSIVIAVAFLAPGLASAQVFSQSQVIIPPFNGVIMSTSTAFGAKLQASTSPTVATINATSTTATSTLSNLNTNSFSIGSLSGILKAVGGYITTALINLTADVTGVLPIANGGTATTSAVTNGVYYYNGTNAEADTALTWNGLNSGGVFKISAGAGVTDSSRISLSNDRGYLGYLGAAQNVVLQSGITKNILIQAGSATFGAATGGIIVSGQTANLGNVGINATSSPFASLSIAGSAGGTTPLFAISSSTAAFATTTVFQIDQNGKLISNALATSTFSGAVQSTCFTINGTSCLTSGSGTVSSGTTGQMPYYAANGTTLTATSTLFLTGGSVGVGLTNPGARFEVQGTTTDATAQSADFWNSANTNLLRIRNDGNIGIGSTSPWALLSVNANGVPLTSAQFSVGSSTATNLVVANNGFVGVGTSSPVSPFTIVAPNPSNLSGLGLYSGASNRFTSFTIGRTAVEFTFAIAAGTNQFVMGAQAGDSLLQGNNNLFINTAALKTQTTGGVFGIGTTTPSGLFSAQITPSTQSKIPFILGSTTLAFATTTLFIIDNTGSTTAANGFNITDGCYAKNGTCISTGGAGTNFWTLLAGNIYNNTGARVQFPLFDATSTTGTSTITSSLAIGSGVQNTYLSVGTTSPAAGYAKNYLADFTGNLNDFISLNVNNNTSGACATADLTATNDVGSISANFADLGHTSSAFTGSGCTNNPFPGFGANSTYLFDPNGNVNFAIASTSDASFRFFTGGYAAVNQKAVLTNTGRLGVGTSTPWRTLSITGTVGFDGLTAGSGTALCLSTNKELVTCTGGSGTVTSVATDATLTGGPITTTGTLGLNLANSNKWTALQQFNGNASSTQLSAYTGLYVGDTATSTILGSATSTIQSGLNIPNGGLKIGTTLSGVVHAVSGAIVTSLVNLATEVTGILSVVNGGSGLASLTPYALLAGGTTSTGVEQQVSGVGTTGQVLTSNGASALPTWQTESASLVTSTATTSITSGADLYSNSISLVSGDTITVWATSAKLGTVGSSCANVGAQVFGALIFKQSTFAASTTYTTAGADAPSSSAACDATFLGNFVATTTQTLNVQYDDQNGYDRATMIVQKVH